MTHSLCHVMFFTRSVVFYAICVKHCIDVVTHYNDCGTFAVSYSASPNYVSSVQSLMHLYDANYICILFFQTGNRSPAHSTTLSVC